MPLQLPNLDDRNYDSLVEEARSLIPNYAPGWTNHNASDPGITLVELFAYLSEILIYRLNRVTAANVLSFLKLLNGPAWMPAGKRPDELTPAEIMQAVPETILKLRKLDRAVSCPDFETLALEADARVSRARCLPRVNIEADPERERPGHVSVIVLVQPGAEAEVVKAVEDYLAPKLLLTTRVHVDVPRFLGVTVAATVVPLPDQLEAGVIERVADAVRNFLDPLAGGEEGRGWPFGRNVFVSEIYSLIDRLPAIDFVISVDLIPGAPGRLIRNAAGELVGAEVKDYELVRVLNVNVTLEDQTA